MSFEQVIHYLNEGAMLDNYDHPNQDKYPNQKIFVIEMNHYAYIVPYIESDDVIFFKTIIPSRQATKKYLESK